MNSRQFQLIAEKLNLDDKQTQACEIVILNNKSCYAAEKEVYGKVTNTIGRTVKVVQGVYDFAVKLMNENTPVK